MDAVAELTDLHTRSAFPQSTVAPLKAFDRIDHLMIEVDDPLLAYREFEAAFSLPQAWPLTETENYSSVGVNFGNVNIELIRFRVRFGLSPVVPCTGLSGVCLTSRFGVETVRAELDAQAVAWLGGEEAPGHRTSVLASKAPPTIFFCEYKFDTAGWKARLRDEFQASQGGRLQVARVVNVGLPHRLLRTHEFIFAHPGSVRLCFSESPRVRLQSANAAWLGKTVVLADTTFAVE